MQRKTQEKFQCPECESKNIRYRFKVNYKDSHVYSGVTEEIQCSNCYMDIPANIFIITENTNINDNKKIWNSFYKPEHLKNAAKCSKCNLFYWEIEQELVKQNIITTDIFYQSFNVRGESSKKVCRLCDSSSFNK